MPVDPAILRERDLSPFPAEQGFAVQAVESAIRADFVEAEAKEPAARRGSALEEVEPAYLVQPYGDFTDAASGEQAMALAY